MKMFRSRVAASLAVLAVTTMTVTPAMARGPHSWRPPHHHRGGVSGGDLLAGLLVIGGVAAIASAASKKSSDADTRQPEQYRYPGGPIEGDAGYADDSVDDSQRGTQSYPLDGAASYERSGNFGAAVDTCAEEIERSNVRIDSVDSVRRMGERYSVQGHLQDGRGYACSVDEGGQIRSVAVDGKALY